MLRLKWMVPLLALAIAGCSKQAPVQEERNMAAPVLVTTVESKNMPVETTGIGTVEAYATVSIKSLVAGALDQVHFTQGQEVKKGDLLFTIDPRPVQADLQRAQATLARDTAQLKQSQANVVRDQANAENALVEKHRYEVLFQKGVVAKEQYDTATANAAALEAGVKADQAAVENAQQAIQADLAAIENAKLNLAYCYIRSPIDGRTGDLLVNQGNIVKVNDTTLVVINQIHPIYVNFSVPEQQLPVIRKYSAAGELKVLADIPNDDGPPVQGVLSFIDNSVNSTTGTILLKGTFENNTRRLWPGQFVTVTVTLTTQPNAIVIPNQAIQTGQAGSFVFVVKPDMTVEARPIDVDRTVGELAVIRKGLQPGETIVTDGQIRLVPGARVQVKKAL